MFAPSDKLSAIMAGLDPPTPHDPPRESDDRSETIAELISRLGPLPDDIRERWEAVGWDGDRQRTVEPDGRPATPPAGAAPTSDAGAAPVQSTVEGPIPSRPTGRGGSPEPPDGRSHRRILTASSIAAAAVVVFVIGWRWRPRPSASIVANPPGEPPPMTSPRREPDAEPPVDDGPEPLTMASVPPPEDFENSINPTAVSAFDLASLGFPAADPAEGMTFDDAGGGSGTPDPADGSDDSPEDGSIGETIASVPAAPVPDADGMTRHTVDLPPIDDPAPVRLTDTPLSEPRIEALATVQPTLRPTGDGGYDILLRDDIAARITSDASGSFFRWPDGGRVGGAASLANARIRDGERVIELRRPRVADPLRLCFDDWQGESVVTIGWSPFRPAVSATLDVDLPDAYELSWVEPPPDTFPYKGTAVATITDAAAGDEAAAVGFRVTGKCGRRLALRVRTAARLDRSQPWFPLSRENLSGVESWLTRLADAVAAESARLDRVDDVAYKIAGREGKQIIAAKIDRNDDRGDDVATLLERVAELRGMLDDLESDARLRLRLRHRWPDGDRDVLVLTDESA